MPARCRVDPETQSAVIELSGSLGARELVMALASVLEDPQWQPGFDVLVDGASVEELLLTFGDVREVASIVIDNTELLGSGRTAFVLNGGHGRMLLQSYIAATEGPTRVRKIFDSVEAARVWLGKRQRA